VELKIFIDRLKDGQIEKFKLEVPCDFLGIQEDDLSFIAPVTLKGESYLASDHLILKLHVETKILMPCSICNEPTKLPIVIADFTQAEPIENIRSSVYDYTEALREEILLQVPQFTECNEGNCPQRDSMKKFLKAEKAPEAKQNPSPVHFPFSDL